MYRGRQRPASQLQLEQQQRLPLLGIMHVKLYRKERSTLKRKKTKKKKIANKQKFERRKKWNKFVGIASRRLTTDAGSDFS